MDRTASVAAVVFAAFAIVGVWLTVSPGSISGTDADALRAIGATLFGAGLTTLLVTVLHADYHRRHD